MSFSYALSPIVATGCRCVGTKGTLPVDINDITSTVFTNENIISTENL